jgi:hypothetical protein
MQSFARCLGGFARTGAIACATGLIFDLPAHASPQASPVQLKSPTPSAPSGAVSYEYHGGGRVTMRFANGSVYRGTHKNGVIDGYGAMKYSDAPHAYIGEWKDGKHHGRGILRNALCAVYVGDFLNDDKHGKGKGVIRV